MSRGRLNGPEYDTWLRQLHEAFHREVVALPGFTWRAEEPQQPDAPPVIFETTREAWLERLVSIFRFGFTKMGYKLPDKIYISVGYAPTNQLKSLGVCFPSASSDDGGTHVFVSPVLSDYVRVGGVVMHELCHAALCAAVE